MSGIFVTADEARNGARNYGIIHTEASQIETAILSAVATGAFSVLITNQTTMTNNTTGIPYYNSWHGLTIDRVLNDQMSLVIAYFVGLGYSIVQLLNTSTNNTFSWYIQW